jgi:hypothetical protein
MAFSRFLRAADDPAGRLGWHHKPMRLAFQMGLPGRGLTKHAAGTRFHIRYGGKTDIRWQASMSASSQERSFAIT